MMTTWDKLAETLMSRAAEYEPGANRKPALLALAGYVTDKIKAEKPVRLNFICTHNSRRSHFGQAMAQVLGAYLKIPRFETYSGGTEATAFHPHAVRALEELGLSVEKISAGENPHYRLTTGPAVSEVFSKHYATAPNPQKDFAAIMVCSSADAGCPVVSGAERRISLPFEDPKISDGTPAEEATYRARALEIGTELAWALAKVV